jgi:hypothetical protein
MLFLRILVLICTAWAVQDINRYSGKFEGFIIILTFWGRMSIADGIGQRVEKKIVPKDVDIVPFISQVLDWTQKKPNIFREEKCFILNFG